MKAGMAVNARTVTPGSISALTRDRLEAAKMMHEVYEGAVCVNNEKGLPVGFVLHKKDIPERDINEGIEIGDPVYHPLDESACIVIDILEGGRYVLTTTGKDKYTTRKSTKLTTIPAKRPSPLMALYEELAFGSHFYPRSKKINPICILTGL